MTNFGYSTALNGMISEGSEFLDMSGSLRLLLSETDHDIDLAYYTGCSEGFTKWQQIVDPLYYQQPFEERARIAAGLLVNRSAEWPRLLRKALSLGPLPALTCSHAQSAAEDVLHGVAECMGGIKFFLFENNDWDSMKKGDFMSASTYTNQYKVSSHADQ